MHHGGVSVQREGFGMTSASDSKRRDAAPDNAPGRGFIYGITCLSKQKRYVGQTVNFNQRIWTHRSSLRNNKHWCTEMQFDWNELGSTDFSFDLLQEVPLYEMKFAEAKHILEASVNLNGCYNYLISVDPKTGTLTPISRLREKQSEALKKAWNDPTTFLARPIRRRWDNPDQKRIHSESQKKRYLDPEQRRITSETTKAGWAKRKARLISELD